MVKMTVHSDDDIRAINQRKYKQEELQAIWDKIDAAYKEITNLKKENTRLKNKLKAVEK